MGKGNKQTTTQQQTQNSTTSTQIDPTIQNQAYTNLNTANNVAANWNPTLQNAPAGFTPDQQAAFEAARNANQAGAGTLQAGINGATAAMAYQPLSVSGQGYNAAGYNGALVDPTGYQASLLGPAQTYQAVAAGSSGYDAAQLGDAKGYQANSTSAAHLDPNAVQQISTQNTNEQLNPYLQSFNQQFDSSLIQPALNDLDRQRQMTMNDQNAMAAKQGAFGGDRQALYNAETNRAFADKAQQMIANLKLGGLQSAIGALQNDASRNLTAQQANQGANLQAGLANSGYQQQANMANAGFQNDAAKYLADMGNQFQVQNAQFKNEASQFAADAANKAAAQNAAAQTQANAANAAAQNANAAQNAGYLNQAGQFNSNLGFQGQLANQGSLNQAGQFNAGAANQANQFNAGAANNAALANQQAGLAGANLNLNAAGMLTNQAGQQQNNAYNYANALLGIGGQQQQQAQNLLNTQYQNQTALDNADLTRLGIQQNALGMTPYGTTTTSNGTSSGTSTTKNTPSFMSQLGQVAGLAGMFLSDKRLKEDVRPMGSALSAVRKMKGVSYKWKPGLGFPGSEDRHDMGLLAQDVERAHPGAVKTINGVKHVNGPAVLGLLTNAVKELDRRTR